MAALVVGAVVFAPVGDAAPDRKAPTQPTSFHGVSRTTTSISTAWTASTDNVGVTGYTLYLNGVSQSTTAQTNFTFAGLTCGTKYTLGVDAFDAAGNHSTMAAITVSTSACGGDTTPPSQPGSFQVTNTAATSLATSWTASTDNVGVTGYTLYLNGVSQGTTTQLTATFSGLTCGTSYTLGVDAFDAAGNHSTQATLNRSTSACTDPTPPTKPTNFQVTNTAQTSLATSWTASTDNVGVTGYTLYLNGVSQGTTTQLTATFGGLTCGTSYTLGVDAFDAAGNHSTPATTSGTTSACGDRTPPSAPANLTLTAASKTSLALSWTASTDNVGVTGYTAYLAGLTQGTTTQLSWTFSGLTCGTSYTLGVDAFDAVDNHSMLGTIVASTNACSDTTPPTQPGNLQVTARTPTSLTFSWTGSTDNVGVAGYTAYKNGLSWGWTTTGMTWTFGNLGCNSTTTLGIDAYDASNNHSTIATISATTGPCDTTAPTQPTSFRTSNTSTTSISTAWSASSDDVGVAGYTVLVNGASVGATTSTSRVFGGLACGKSYTLGVYARDAAANNSATATLTASTKSCSDTTPPTQPSSFHATSATATSLATSWTVSTDNVGVSGYTPYLNGVSQATTAQTNYTFSGLICGTSYTLGVDAYDAAGNHSTRATVSVSTASCSPGAVLTVDRSKPLKVTSLSLGATQTSPGLDPWYGDPTAEANGKALLSAVAVYQNQHIYGLGVTNPEPSPGVFNWGQLDARVNEMRSMGAIPVISLCCAPDWMTSLGTNTMTNPFLPPTSAHVADFADLARAIALRYPDVKYFDVWNQMKGLWNPSTQNWDYVAYTNMYNAVYDALKGVDPTIQVGGPYLGLDVDPNNQILASQQQVITYWLANKHGADFISFSHAIVPFNATSIPSTTTILSETNEFEALEQQIHSLTSLPIWWAEDYFDGNFPRISYANDNFQQVALASILAHEVLGGASVSLRFQPDGDRTRPYNGDQESLFTDTTVSGGGQAFPNWRIYQIFHDDFPSGTQLYTTTSSSPDIEVLASATHTLAINKTTGTVPFTLNGQAQTPLAPYEVRLI